MKAEPDLNDYVMRFYFLISEGHSLAVIYIYMHTVTCQYLRFPEDICEQMHMFSVPLYISESHR